MIWSWRTLRRAGIMDPWWMMSRAEVEAEIDALRCTSWKRMF